MCRLFFLLMLLPVNPLLAVERGRCRRAIDKTWRVLGVSLETLRWISYTADARWEAKQRWNSIDREADKSEFRRLSHEKVEKFWNFEVPLRSALNDGEARKVEFQISRSRNFYNVQLGTIDPEYLPNFWTAVRRATLRSNGELSGKLVHMDLSFVMNPYAEGLKRKYDFGNESIIDQVPRLLEEEGISLIGFLNLRIPSSWAGKIFTGHLFEELLQNDRKSSSSLNSYFIFDSSGRDIPEGNLSTWEDLYQAFFPRVMAKNSRSSLGPIELPVYTREELQAEQNRFSP